MAEEVYEGAIGIDLGTMSCKSDSIACNLLNVLQVPHTHVLPTTKAQMWKSVYITLPLFLESELTVFAYSCQRAGKLHHALIRFIHR